MKCSKYFKRLVIYFEWMLACHVIVILNKILTYLLKFKLPFFSEVKDEQIICLLIF